ncbi:hypothetical protein GALMADRAFT_281083 [Galerina marginata CBS 339.88]|uniref:glucan endo-1,3-beta-D-glucosidase n=1 Tax=Galerina marginata (strain CBS 339.88) TaxID=685588 RepID=A0A067SRY9_GALM3|nr:hypothetical protein GALMADRAFT_281083 [Galerina marginata CBS 339.88]
MVPLLAAVFSLFAAPVLAGNHFAGLTVSNSAGGVTGYACRTQAQWNQLAKDAKGNGFNAIRILGFDCNSLDMASSAAAAAGIQVMAGIWVANTMAGSQTQIDNDVQTFRTAYSKYGASRFVGLTIGNEVNDTPSNIIAKVKSVKASLSSAGITTPVSTVHTWVTIRDNAAFCGADFIGANAHAFYDGNVVSNQAGNFLFNTVVPGLKRTCPGKKIYITETGWPSRGSNLGSAVASTGDEQNAISSINCACPRDTSVSVYGFEYDDQLWKSNDNERSFGLFNKIPLSPGALSAC